MGEIVKIRRGLTYKPSDICENGIRVLRSSNIDGDSFVLNCDDVFVREQAVNIDYARENDILITAANGSSRLVGKHAILSQIPDKSTVHGGFMLLGSTEEPYFINASMGSSWYRRFVELFVAGGNGAIGNLNKNDLDNQDIFVPSKKEQARIGAFFRHLDRLVALHQCNCNMATRPYEWSSGLRAIAWEQREFKNLFKILPNNTLSRAELSFEKGIVKNLHYGDILIKFNEILDSCDKKIPFISREMNFEKIKNAILKNGDVVIADAAEDEAVGKCTEIFNISQNEQIISGLHTIPCRPNIDFAQGFLGYYMNSNSYHSQLVPLMQGIKVLSLSKSSLQDTLITFPRTKKEQARIGTFFRHLDRLITLHQRKHILLT